MVFASHLEGMSNVCVGLLLNLLCEKAALEEIKCLVVSEVSDRPVQNVPESTFLRSSKCAVCNET